MRGKSKAAWTWPHSESFASMRPAHYAREVGPNQSRQSWNISASMRPAHYAREVGRSSASMFTPDPLQ